MRYQDAETLVRELLLARGYHLEHRHPERISGDLAVRWSISRVPSGSAIALRVGVAVPSRGCGFPGDDIARAPWFGTAEKLSMPVPLTADGRLPVPGSPADPWFAFCMHAFDLTWEALDDAARARALAHVVTEIDGVLAGCRSPRELHERAEANGWSGMHIGPEFAALMLG